MTETTSGRLVAKVIIEWIPRSFLAQADFSVTDYCCCFVLTLEIDVAFVL